MKNSLRILSATLLLASLSACANTNCNDYQAYRYTKAQQPVKVPADLEQPDNRNVAPKAEVKDPDTLHLDASGGCLDKPPKI